MSRLEKRQMLDAALQRCWKLAAKKILDKVCGHKIESMHVGYGLDVGYGLGFRNGLGFYNSAVIGDAENIYMCNVAFSFGEVRRIVIEPVRHNMSKLHAMIDVDELAENESNSVMRALFYSSRPIELVKNRYGAIGKSIAPNSILDALETVGLCAEELLVQSDLSR